MRPAGPAPVPDAELVRKLIAAQFPHWAELPVTPVLPGGWDNRTFRLGPGMKVKLPSAERYAVQPGKEHLWLPRLAPRLPLRIPEPLALGKPDEGFPWPWSVQGWAQGETASAARIRDPARFARDLADFLRALWAADPSGGPPAGPHSFHRGGSLRVYDAETRAAVAILGHAVDGAAALAAWDAALATAWSAPPVWVHGDLAAGNLLLEEGRLSAVIDFGCCATGDPACDLVIAWTLLDGVGRATFREAVGLDSGTWARARGWALWKALITLAGAPGPEASEESRRVLAAVLQEHVESG